MKGIGAWGAWHCPLAATSYKCKIPSVVPVADAIRKGSCRVRSLPQVVRHPAGAKTADPLSIAWNCARRARPGGHPGSGDPANDAFAHLSVGAAHAGMHEVA